MAFVLETLRAAYRKRFGPSVWFPETSGQLRKGDWVRFDCQSKKEGGHVVTTFKVGSVVDLLARDDPEEGRVCELIILVPEIPDLDGGTAVPPKLYRRSIKNVVRHGGPNHAAAP